MPSHDCHEVSILDLSGNALGPEGAVSICGGEKSRGWCSLTCFFKPRAWICWSVLAISIMRRPRICYQIELMLVIFVSFHWGRMLFKWPVVVACVLTMSKSPKLICLFHHLPTSATFVLNSANKKLTDKKNAFLRKNNLSQDVEGEDTISTIEYDRITDNSWWLCSDGSYLMSRNPHGFNFNPEV